MEKELAVLSRQAEISLYFLFDPLEAQLPQGNNYRLSDGNSDLLISTASNQVRTSYQRNFATLRERISTFCKSYRIAFLRPGDDQRSAAVHKWQQRITNACSNHQSLQFSAAARSVSAAGPGFWPPAPGWWLVAALLIILVGLLLLLLHRRKRLAYRRQALKELARLEQQPLGNSELLRALSRLLRRAALCAWPDNSGAGLTGQAWLEFLDARGKTTDFTTGAGQCLASGPYQPEPQFDRPAPVQPVPQLAAPSAATTSAQEIGMIHFDWPWAFLLLPLPLILWKVLPPPWRAKRPRCGFRNCPAST